MGAQSVAVRREAPPATRAKRPLSAGPAAAFPLVDRRASPRFHAVCLDVKVNRGGQVSLFHARNLSDSGMMLNAHLEVVPGERVLIHLSDRLALKSTILWSDGQHFGVQFDQSIDSAAWLHSEAERKRQDKRGGTQRLETMKLATCYAENGIRAVKIVNASHRGLCLAHNGSLQAGMSLKLVVENGIERRGTVRWSREDRAGIRLTDPLTCEELEQIRSGNGCSAD